MDTPNNDKVAPRNNFTTARNIDPSESLDIHTRRDGSVLGFPLVLVGGKDACGHIYAVCMPGDGWTIFAPMTASKREIERRTRHMEPSLRD